MSACKGESESSDDDGILASPVFTKKRNRKTERTEQQKLDFLDSCLSSSNARTVLQRRIAEVEREQHHRLQKVKDEPQLSGSEDDGSMGVKKDDIDETRASEANDDDSNIDGGNPETVPANAEANVKQEPALDSAYTAKSPSTLLDDNEISYWERVENFAKTNAATKKKRGTYARRKLSDAIDGIGSDSETDDEDGKWVDGSSGMTREQKRSEAAAKMTGEQSLLGLRRMFLSIGRPVDETKKKMSSRKQKQCEELGFYLFNTREEAKKDLKSIMTALEKSHHNPSTDAQSALRKDFIDPLSKLVKKSPQKLFWINMTFFLHHNPIVTLRSERTCAFVIPEVFCKWMWKVSCSSYRVMGKITLSTCQLLVRYLREKLDVDDFQSYAGLSFLKKFKIDHIALCLENDFGLWLKPGPAVFPKVEPGIKTEEKDIKDASTLDAVALKNFFVLCTALLDRDYFCIAGNGAENGVGKGATSALVSVTRASLDVGLWTSDSYSSGCARMLPSVIPDLSASIVKSAARQIAKECVEEWMTNTAESVVESCCNLAAGDPGSTDADDAHGNLPLATVVTKLLTREVAEFSSDVALMKMYLAERALRSCLHDITDWDDKVKELMDSRCRELSNDDSDEIPCTEMFFHATHAVVTAEVGLEWIEKHMELMMQDKSRFLAAVQIAGECALVGVALFRCTNLDNETGKFKYSTEENDAICESLTNLEDLCNGVKMECRAVIAYPHLRRVKEYLTRLGKSIGGTRGISSKDQRKRMREQGSLDSWIARPFDSLNSP
mmetsp:Transcript_17351/g.36176  ORF Transcript_17351/g.36176 Transcript_17351/m.36176 type:complete len:782 (-) Transcript_17351:105-2450(-)